MLNGNLVACNSDEPGDSEIGLWMIWRVYLAQIETEGPERAFPLPVAFSNLRSCLPRFGFSIGLSGDMDGSRSNNLEQWTCVDWNI